MRKQSKRAKTIADEIKMLDALTDAANALRDVLKLPEGRYVIIEVINSDGESLGAVINENLTD